MSTAAAYPNSVEFGSEKTSAKFKRISQIRASTLAERHRNLIVAMMHKNQFGDELWMETNHIAAVIGRKCNRRKPGTITRTVKGRQQLVHLGPCEIASRRTVQRLIDELVYCRECGKPSSAHSSTHKFVPRVEGGGVLDEVYPANTYVPFGGGKHYRPSATYRLVHERLTPRKTSEQYVEERERNRKRKGMHRVVEIAKPQPEPVPEPAPAANPPTEPVAQEASRRITRDERIALTQIYLTLRKNSIQHEAAIQQACRELKIPVEDGEVALKIALATRAARQGSPPRRSKAEERRDQNIEANRRAKERLRKLFGLENDPWIKIASELKSKINVHSFDTWFRPLGPSYVEHDVLIVLIPTLEFQHAAEKYAAQIRAAIESLGLPFKDVKFVTGEELETPESGEERGTQS